MRSVGLNVTKHSVKAKTRAVANWIWLIAIVISGVAAIAKEQSSSARIDQTAFVPLGGIDQWISIRGESRANPVLLLVHGGPGEAQWPEAEVYRPWEKDFIVVQWDQRGSGHTFGRYGTKTPDVTLDRISKDGVELAEYLCRNLGKSFAASFGPTIVDSEVPTLAPTQLTQPLHKSGGPFALDRSRLTA